MRMPAMACGDSMPWASNHCRHNRGRVLIGGRSYPLAGRVCMDQTMVVVGDAEVRAGDEVVLIGRQGGDEITVTEVADLMGTIGYEVTCLIAGRVTRASE